MEPFHQIFPEATDPITTLTLPRKTGSIPKGSYGFVECYCTDPGCDCRRVLLLVLNDKMQQKAALFFGFDQQGPLDGPFLEPAGSKAAYAPELLEFFVEKLNCGAQWLERIYRQYRAVREKLAGKPYRGKAFPKPGRLRYRALPAPELEELLAQSLRELPVLGRSPAISATSATPASGKVSAKAGSRAKPAARKATGSTARGLLSLVGRYALQAGRSVDHHARLRDELRRYLLADELAGEELAALLPALCQQSPEDDERIDGALRLLFDALEILRLELECHRPAGRLRMERLQGALARRVFDENEDLDLCAAVTQVLVQSRVEILPVLREANRRMLQAGAARADLLDEPGEELMAGIVRSLESMGLASPFEGVEALLQLFALNEPEVQTALIAEMLDADQPLLREIAALMLFHPDAGVRLAVSRLLADREGLSTGPQTLRRLIVSRNWFPEEIRVNLDQAVGKARRARVECAPLDKAPALTVYASTMDGAGAQSFQVVVPEGKGFYSCSILLKQGTGVADAFVVPLAGKRELNGFLSMLKRQACFVESTAELLDLRVCQALGEGVRRGNAPGCSLVRIAELLGCDRWQAASFDAQRELAKLREQMTAITPRLLDPHEYRLALQESAEWQAGEPMLASWFEDDQALDCEIELLPGAGRSLDAAAAIELIETVVLEKRRAVWLERLVLTTLWLKSAKRAPVPWHRMFHVAQAVADDRVALKEIPLMSGVALLSLNAYLERNGAGGPGHGARR